MEEKLGERVERAEEVEEFMMIVSGGARDAVDGVTVDPAEGFGDDEFGVDSFVGRDVDDFREYVDGSVRMMDFTILGGNAWKDESDSFSGTGEFKEEEEEEEEVAVKGEEEE